MKEKKKKSHIFIYTSWRGWGLKVCFFPAETNTVFSFDFLIPNGKVNESEKSLHK